MSNEQVWIRLADSKNTVVRLDQIVGYRTSEDSVQVFLAFPVDPLGVRHCVFVSGGVTEFEEQLRKASAVVTPRSTPRSTRRVEEKPAVYVSPSKAAQHVGCTSRTIRRWIAEGRLPAQRFGPRTVRVLLADVEVLGKRIPTVGQDR